MTMHMQPRHMPLPEPDRFDRVWALQRELAQLKARIAALDPFLIGHNPMGSAVGHLEDAWNRMSDELTRLDGARYWGRLPGERPRQYALEEAEG